MIRRPLIKLDQAAERIQPALRCLAEIRTANAERRPGGVSAACNELERLLLAIEDSVGVRTPAALFE